MAELSIQKGFLNIQGADLYYEIAGQGHPLLLIHAGIADSRMWDQQFEVFAHQYRVIRYDLRGYGQSSYPEGPFANYEDPALLLKALDIKQAHIVGVSFGGLVALDLALAHPEMVTSLVLAAPSVSGRKPSAEALQFMSEEDALFERGDLKAATELNLRMWVDGPRRTPQQVDPAVRQLVYDMQYHAFTIPTPEQARELRLDPPAISRLSEIRVPTLLIVGDYDLSDKIKLVEQLASEIPQARHVMIAGGGHVVSMEQSTAFNKVVLDFLSQFPA